MDRRGLNRRNAYIDGTRAHKWWLPLVNYNSRPDRANQGSARKSCKNLAFWWYKEGSLHFKPLLQSPMVLWKVSWGYLLDAFFLLSMLHPTLRHFPSREWRSEPPEEKKEILFDPGNFINSLVCRISIESLNCGTSFIDITRREEKEINILKSALGCEVKSNQIQLAWWLRSNTDLKKKKKLRLKTTKIGTVK